MTTSAGKTRLGRLVDGFGLVLVSAVALVAVRYAPAAQRDAALVAALGFLLLAGTLMGELVEVVGIPHLTGYLLTGMLAGPHVLHLIDHDTVERLTPVNTLALALIALEGGAHLKLDELKRISKSLAAATAMQTLLNVSLVGAVFFAAQPFLSFTRNLPLGSVIAASLLWGVVAIARSPSAALGIISQTRAMGPLARHTLACVMASDVVVVVVMAGAVTLARPLVNPTLVLSSDAFGILGHELFGSVALGTTLGLLLAVYLRLSGRQLLVVLVALGFGATEVLRYLHYDALLTFMVAGFVVRNLSSQAEKLLKSVEQTGSVVYVVFFASAGAHSNVPLLRQLWPIALLLAFSRILVTFAAGKIASRIAGDIPVVRRWAWAPLVSQAGFALGIAQLATRDFPTFGRGFGDLAIATVAINEIIGPIIFKFALDRGKETRAPTSSLPEAEDVVGA